jgi:hypothetical protein
MAVAPVVVVVVALVLAHDLGSSGGSASPVVTGADRTPAVAPLAAVKALSTIARRRSTGSGRTARRPRSR